MEEWKEYKLGDLIVLSSGGTPNKNNSSYWDGDIPWISAKAMYDDYLYTSDITITREGLNHGSKLAPVNSILLLTRGSGLFNRIPVCLVKREMAFNQDVKCIESKDKNVVSNIFLFYWLMGHKREISNILETTGIGAGKIDTERLKNLSISLPPIQTQLVLITFAESLILKIEVNRRINENLEQQTQALFKSWFVDFEPFKDGEFVESELGMIPKGWRVGTVNDVCCFESGFAFKSTTYKQEGEYHLITIKNVQDGYLDVNGSVCLDELPAKMPQYCLLRIGDILLSLTGNVGRCCFVDEERLLLNQRVAKLKPRIKNNWGYIYTLFRNPSFKDRVLSIARGTAQANLSPIETSNMIIIIPIDKVLEDFSAIVDESYRIMINNMIEPRRLAELRDTLLPKLMSGELKVNEVEI